MSSGQYVIVMDAATLSSTTLMNFYSSMGHTELHDAKENKDDVNRSEINEECRSSVSGVVAE